MFLCAIQTLALVDIITNVLERVDEVSHSISDNVEIAFAAFGSCLTWITSYA
jgi:hypothetical protein